MPNWHKCKQGQNKWWRGLRPPTCQGKHIFSLSVHSSSSLLAPACSLWQFLALESSGILAPTYPSPRFHPIPPHTHPKSPHSLGVNPSSETNFSCTFTSQS